MKKIAKIVLAFALVFSVICISGCSETKQAQKSVESMFDCLKKGDYNGALPYISRMEGDNDFLATGGKFTEDGFAAYEMHKALFESIDYKIKDIRIDNPAAAVADVELTALNLEPVAEELFKTTNEYNFMAENNEAEITKDEINAFLTQQMIDISKEYIESNDKITKTYNIKVNICYEKDREWRVYPDETLIDALTGGVYTKYDELLTQYVGKK